MAYKSPPLTNWQTALIEWSKKYSEYLQGDQEKACWMTNNDVSTLNIELIKIIFNDPTLQQTFFNSHAKRDPYADTTKLSLQINELDSLHRSYRSRHLTPVRALFNSASRFIGQSERIERDNA